MASGRYPFIDIAAHDRIRNGYADGDAQVVLAHNVRDVLWVNGAGARLFGYPDLYAFMDEGFSEGTATFRQVEAAIRASQTSPGRSVHRFTMRTGTGIHRPITPATVERITLADGNRVFLLSCKIHKPAVNAAEKAIHILDGFEDAETLAAVLDEEGEVVGSTDSFKRLQMESATRRTLVEDVERDTDRLVKHPVRTALGYLPAAIARISDDPALHLLFAVETSIGTLDPDIDRSAPGPTVAPADEQTTTPFDDGTITPTEPGSELEAEAVTDGFPPAEDDRKMENAISDPFVFDPQKRPVRFVWRVDADGVFKELSREFAETIGPNAADIVGRRFSDVALVFNLDPDHEIVDLLQRRDTWSGKTVHWPVQGTDLVVPVDLAALPTYSRERVFDGFRGFGIIRCGDASEDPERIGLALSGPPPQPPAEQVKTGGSSVVSEAEEGPDETESGRQSPEAALPEQADVDDIERADKVIKLEERRPRPREGLSATEQQALREIAERLSRSMDDEEPGHPFGRRPNAELEKTQEVSSKIPATPSKAESQDKTDEAPDTRDFDSEAGPEEVSEPSGWKVTIEDLETLDRPAVIHDGSIVFYANRRLLADTGYDGIDEINEHGGLHALIGAQEDEDGIIGPMLLHGADGGNYAVSARLRSVVWDGKKALLLDFLPVPSGIPGEDLEDQLEDEVVEEASETSEADDDNARISELEVEVEELRSILETATDGVVLLGRDGNIRSLNRSALALFDCDDADVRGKPFAFLFAHESQRAIQDYLTGLSDHGVASVLNDGREVIGREASGRFLPLFMTIGRLSGSNGYCAVMRDITHWKRTEEELRTAKRSAEAASLHKTEFLARVSHEIRTPLNAIIGFSDLMAEERFGPIGSPRYVEYARDIGRSGRHVLDIVNDLLDISKIEAGEQELDFQSISLNQLLLDAVTILQPQANSQRVIIRTSMSSQLPNVVADPRSIKQIAINILSNAVRFTPPGGQAVVSSSYEKDGSAVVRIRDTGVGMTRHQLDEAMKPFRQVTASPRPRGEGTGLGLPLAKAMTEANRAEFAMESEPGRGTLVEIRFPPQRVLAE